jgi:hypothetical protein
MDLVIDIRQSLLSWRAKGQSHYYQRPQGYR